MNLHKYQSFFLLEVYRLQGWQYLHEHSLLIDNQYQVLPVKLDIDCQLVNCVHADTATLAIDKLLKEKSFGIYANSSVYKKNKLEGFVSDSDEWHYHNHQPIDHIQYKDFVQEWISKGASVIGGCCRTTTKHIQEIRNIVDQL